MVEQCMNNMPIMKADLVIAGDLSNQIAISNYSASKIDKPMLGIYAACATINEGIGLAAMLLEQPKINNVLVYTSSYNQTAERQFRSPIEYGGERCDSQTFTSTIAA
jgi:stage V sporulation protein AD